MLSTVKMSDVLKLTKLCIKCKKESTFSCSRCEDRYCSVICQRIDWQRHRYHCIPMPPLISDKFILDEIKNMLVIENSKEMCNPNNKALQDEHQQSVENHVIVHKKSSELPRLSGELDNMATSKFENEKKTDEKVPIIYEEREDQTLTSVKEVPDKPKSVNSSSIDEVPKSGLKTTTSVIQPVTAAVTVNSTVYQTPPIRSPVTQAAPIKSTVTQAAPIKSTVNQAAPIRSNVHQAEPLRSTVNPVAPIRSTVHQADTIRSTVTQAPPIRSTVHQAEPIRSTVPQAEPIRSTVTQAPPIRSTAVEPVQPSITESPVVTLTKPVEKGLADIKFRKWPERKQINVRLLSHVNHKNFSIVEDNPLYDLQCEIMTKDIAEYISACKKMSYIPKAEELVLAKFESDYYRALVLGVGTDSYTVLYLDYGNLNEVQAEEMIKIPRFLLEMDVFPVICYVTNYPDELSQEQEEVLNTGKIIIEDFQLVSAGRCQVKFYGF